jgi:hypothetical protein
MPSTPRARRTTQEANRESHLTARGAGKKLVESDNVRERRIIQAFPADHKLFAEITQMRDGTAERSTSETLINEKDAPWGYARRVCWNRPA